MNGSGDRGKEAGSRHIKTRKDAKEEVILSTFSLMATWMSEKITFWLDDPLKPMIIQNELSLVGWAAIFTCKIITFCLMWSLCSTCTTLTKYVSKDSVRTYCAHRRLPCSKHQLSNAPIIVRVFKGHGGGEVGWWWGLGSTAVCLTSLEGSYPGSNVEESGNLSHHKLYRGKGCGNYAEA